MVSFQSVQTSHALTLPNPKFGDSHSVSFRRINRESRGNDLIIGPLGSPDTDLFRWEWDYLCERQFLRAREFQEAVVGLPVEITDHYGQTHEVVIINQPEFSQVGVENRTVIFDMQVVT